MTTHALHKGDHILFDDCARCEEHALDPLKDLDASLLDKLVAIALQASLDVTSLSDAELIAIREIKFAIADYRKIERSIGRLERRE